MYIKLIRNKPQGKAVFGTLYVDSLMENYQHRYAFTMDTLEHLEYAIPTGFYRLRLTHSPKFGEILPILDGVYGYARQPHNGTRRTGIRIHAGNTIEHTTGCILVGEKDPLPRDTKSKHRLLSSRRALNELREYLLNYQKQNPNEAIYIQISNTMDSAMLDVLQDDWS